MFLFVSLNQRSPPIKHIGQVIYVCMYTEPTQVAYYCEYLYMCVASLRCKWVATCSLSGKHTTRSASSCVSEPGRADWPSVGMEGCLSIHFWLWQPGGICHQAACRVAAHPLDLQQSAYSNPKTKQRVALQEACNPRKAAVG